MTSPAFGTDPGNEHATVTLNGEPVDPTTLPGYGTQWTVRDDGLVENLVPGDQLTTPAPSGLQTWVNGENRQTIGVVEVIRPSPAMPESPAPDPATPATTAPVVPETPAPEPDEPATPATPASVTVTRAPGGWFVHAEYEVGKIVHEFVREVGHGIGHVEAWFRNHPKA